MKRFIALVLMFSMLFTATLSASTKVDIDNIDTEDGYEVVEKDADCNHCLIDFIGTFFLGKIGFHQFYNGHIATGLLFLFTGGLFGIGYIYSIVVTSVALAQCNK